MADIISQLPFLFIASLIASVLLFPLVFVLSFVYDGLAERYKKTPKFIIMYALTLVGAFIALFLLNAYLEYTLPQIAAAATSP